MKDNPRHQSLCPTTPSAPPLLPSAHSLCVRVCVRARVHMCVCEQEGKMWLYQWLRCTSLHWSLSSSYTLSLSLVLSLSFSLSLSRSLSLSLSLSPSLFACVHMCVCSCVCVPVCVRVYKWTPLPWDVPPGSGVARPILLIHTHIPHIHDAFQQVQVAAWRSSFGVLSSKSKHLQHIRGCSVMCVSIFERLTCRIGEGILESKHRPHCLQQSPRTPSDPHLAVINS